MKSTAEPIRVLQVIGAMDRGGAETLVMNLYRNIDRSRIQFDFLVNEKRECDFDSEIKELGGKIYYIPRYKIFNYFHYKAECRKFFSNHHYSIVHGHIGLPAAIYLNIAKHNGAFTIAHSHRANFPLNPSELAFRICSSSVRNVADYFIACSEQAGIDRFGNAITHGPNYAVLKNGVDLNKMHYDQAARALIRNELNIPLNAPVFGHVGRLTEIKNHRFLLDVFSEILKRKPESILLLCGRGELEKQLKFQAQELGIDQSVQFLGVRDDIPKVLSAVDVFLFPSLSEGLGLAVVEAQSSGLPCIVSTGVPDSVKIREQTEFLDLSLGANKWASEAIKALSECDASTRDKAFINAQVAGFDIKDSTNWLCKLYLSHYRPS